MDESIPVSRPVNAARWQRHPVTHLLATIAAITPVYALSILNGAAMLTTGEMQQWTVWNSLAGVILTLGVFGAWVLALLHFICGDTLAALQSKSGTLLHDVEQGVIYAFVILVAMAVLGAMFSQSGAVEVPMVNRGIAEALAADRTLFVVWLGPVMWLQAALLEELYRAFALSRLWRVWPSPTGRILVIVGYSLLFGMGHLYEGPLGIVGTALISSVLSVYYLRHGRLLPMIIAHGIYNSIVLCGLVFFAQHGWF